MEGELMVEKLRRGIYVAKNRDGNSTPSPTWKLGFFQSDGTLIQDPNPAKNTLSARKLGATLWEMQPQLVEKTSNKNGSGLIRRKQDDADVSDPQPRNQKSASNGKGLKKQTESSQAQHKQRVEKIGQAQQPLSSASYSSSMEMSKGKFVESSDKTSHGLKTSTELLKVLNRIWSLEEKHTLDKSLVKTLWTELGQSQDQIQELLKEKHRDEKEIDDLTSKITDLKVVMRNDQGRIKDAVHLLDEKLRNEMKSRRHTEKHHHKLAKELSGMKYSFTNALEELEREKKSRGLLEDLCDEFAKGIRDYEQEIRVMKQKSSEDRTPREGNDRFILHISEAWLDGRTQMKLADTSENQSPLDKLCIEIKAFLRQRKLGKANEEEKDDDEDDDSVDIVSNRSLKKEYEKFALDNMGSEGRSDDLKVKGRDSSVSFVEGSFDPSMFTGPTSPIKKWISRVSAAESSSRWSEGVKPNNLKAKLAEARLKGPMSRARTSRSLSTKSTTRDV